jgi:AbrB family looped-hinge helix DNA binding protein
MEALATTRLSSKGQVVIPEEVRTRLGLKAGVQFVVVGDGDVVVLKVVTPPSRSDFGDLLTKARRQARRAGMKRSDITEAVRKARSKR